MKDRTANTLLTVIAAVCLAGAAGTAVFAADLPTLSVESNLYGSADTNGYTTLKAEEEEHDVLYDDSTAAVMTISFADGSDVDDQLIDTSQAYVSLDEGDGYYVEDLLFHGEELEGAFENGTLSYQLHTGDLEWKQPEGYEVDNGGVEWSCQGGNGNGEYVFNLSVHGILYDGQELDPASFRATVYIYGREFSAESSPSNPSASRWGAGGYDAVELPLPAKKPLEEKVTAENEPVWTWVGDNTYGKPIICDYSHEEQQMMGPGPGGPNGQGGPEGQGGPNGQGGPEGQNGPDGQESPEGQNGPEGQSGPEEQSGPESQSEPDGQEEPKQEESESGSYHDATDNFYVTWPEGTDASKLEAEDVTITLSGKYGDTYVLQPNTGLKTVEQNGEEIADGEYSVFADAAVTQIAVNMVYWAYTPVYTTMTIEVNTDKVEGFDGEASYTTEIGSVYTYMVQTGGGLDYYGTVTAQVVYGLSNANEVELSDVGSCPTSFNYAYLQGEGMQKQAVAFLTDNGDGTYSVTENEEEATVYEADNDPAWIGHLLLSTNKDEPIEAEWNGETVAFSKNYNGGTMVQVPDLATTKLKAADGYVLSQSMMWGDHMRWPWLYFNGCGWTKPDGE